MKYNSKEWMAKIRAMRGKGRKKNKKTFKTKIKGMDELLMALKGKGGTLKGKGGRKSKVRTIFGYDIIKPKRIIDISNHISTGLKTNLVVYEVNENGRWVTKQHNFGQEGRIMVDRNSFKVVFNRPFRFDYVRSEFHNK